MRGEDSCADRPVREAFFEWSSARVIVWHHDQCVTSALALFRHMRKIEAIAECARIIHEKSFESLREEITSDPIDTLQQFPYIGPATKHNVISNCALDRCMFF